MATRTDEEIIAFSKTIPGYYDEDELRNLLKITKDLPPDARIVEIGVEFGRSASIFLQTPEHWDTLYLVDNRSHNDVAGRESTQKVLDSIVGCHGLIQCMEEDSAAASKHFDDGSLALLHLDGDHGDGIWTDCELWLTKLKIGGILVAHDYKRSGADPTTGSVFPDVDHAIDDYTVGPDWEDLGTVNTQACRRKIG